VRPAVYKIDELDVRLVEILQKDSSTPAVKIAGMLKVTEGTVRNRINRLRRQGVIRRFTVSIDPMALGQGAIAFVLLNAAPGRTAEVAKRLALIDVVAEVHETHTYGDLLLKVRAKSPSDLADIIASRIKAVPGIAGTQVITVLNAWKDGA
jgi:Lrp/AsnC family transcriptional regulator for asnA, asnC and gidA